MPTQNAEAVASNPEEAKDIARLDESLAAVENGRVRVLLDRQSEPIALPASVVKLLTRAVHALAQGNAVAVTPIEADLTTQQAAELLNVSRPFLIKLLEDGEIPYYNVGSHRRVPYRELLEYRDRRGRVRRRVLAEMAREAQELGLYE